VTVGVNVTEEENAPMSRKAVLVAVVGAVLFVTGYGVAQFRTSVAATHSNPPRAHAAKAAQPQPKAPSIPAPYLDCMGRVVAYQATLTHADAVKLAMGARTIGLLEGSRALRRPDAFDSLLRKYNVAAVKEWDWYRQAERGCEADPLSSSLPSTPSLMN